MDSLTVILLSLLFSAFFSGSEMAFISSNKLLIELNKKKYPTLSKILNVFIKHPSQFISTLLVGNNIALVVYGLEMGQVLKPVINIYIENNLGVVFSQTVISTIIILVTAEFLPKIVFRINSVMSLNVFAVPLLFFYIIFYPISKVTVFLSDFMMRRFLKSSDTTTSTSVVLGRVDLDNLITQHSKKIEDDNDMAQEVKLLKNALDFSKVKIRECIIPRTEIIAIELDESIDELRSKFINTGFSKILIYKESIDNIVGYIHVSSLFKNPENLMSIINPLSIVPQTMNASKMLEIFTKQHRSIALVVDEFGGTAGIVTMEDILEEIFGEIADEHDKSNLIEKQISDDEFEFSGRLEIDYLNDKYNLNLPESDNYETLAGLILNYNESIPKNGEKILITDFQLQIKVASDNRIELIKLLKLEKK